MAPSTTMSGAMAGNAWRVARTSAAESAAASQMIVPAMSAKTRSSGMTLPPCAPDHQTAKRAPKRMMASFICVASKPMSPARTAAASAPGSGSQRVTSRLMTSPPMSSTTSAAYNAAAARSRVTAAGRFQPAIHQTQRMASAPVVESVVTVSGRRTQWFASSV